MWGFLGGQGPLSPVWRRGAGACGQRPPAPPALAPAGQEWAGPVRWLVLGGLRSPVTARVPAAAGSWPLEVPSHSGVPPGLAALSPRGCGGARLLVAVPQQLSWGWLVGGELFVHGGRAGSQALPRSPLR